MWVPYVLYTQLVVCVGYDDYMAVVFLLSKWEQGIENIRKKRIHLRIL